MIGLVNKDDTLALRAFARTMIWAFPLFFGLILPWLFNFNFQWWPLLVSAVLLIQYGLFPATIYYPYRAWMSVALVLGWINTRIILGFTFFAMILPIGMILRALGKLQYNNSPTSQNKSFYIKRDDSIEKQHLERPF